MPDSVFGLTDPKWKGKIGIAPTNASFQAFVTAMRLDVGDDAHAAVARGREGERPEVLREEHAGRRGGRVRRDRVGLVNHYYLYLVKEERPGRADREQVPPGRRPGALVSVAGAGVLASARPRGARRAVRRVPALGRGAALLHRRGGGGRDTRSSPGSTPRPGLPPLDELAGGPTSSSPRSAPSSSDARAAQRDRLHVVSRGGGRRGGRRSPSSARCVTVALLLLPLAYLVIRAASGGGAAGASSARATRSSCSGARCSSSSASTLAAVVDRRAARLARRRAPTCPAGAIWAVAAALPLVIPSYVAAFCLLGALRAARPAAAGCSASSGCPRSTASGARSRR